MPKHVMIDLETWSTASNATIISIGAVKFDPLDPVGPFENFHVAVDPRAYAPLPGLLPQFHIDPETVMWWMHPDRDTARAHWLASQKLDLPTVLSGFGEWYGTESLPTWGNGATFDNVILRHAFTACGLPCPWKFWDDRCYRTLKNEVPAIKLPGPAEMAAILDLTAVPDELRGVPHTALYDAQRQAVHLRRIQAYMHPALHGVETADYTPGVGRNHLGQD